MKNIILSLLAGVVLFSGCAISPTVKSLLSAEQIEKDIVFAGSQVSGKVSAQAKAAIHEGAVELKALVASGVTSADVSAIFAKVKLSIPAADAPVVGLVVDGALIVINQSIAKFGEHNPMVITYVNDVAQGFLDAGF